MKQYIRNLWGILLFATVFSVSANAQHNEGLSKGKIDMDSLKISRYDYMYYQKSEIYVQYGAPSIVEVTGKLNNDTYIDNDKNLKFEGTDYKYSGIAAAGYNFYINPYFCAGLYFGIGEAEMSVTPKESKTVVYKNNIRSYTAMAGLSWIYYREGIWEVSSGVWLGACCKDEHKSKITSDFIPQEADETVIAYNLTACRVRIGSGTFGGFAELGFGYKGIFNAGLSVKF